MPSVRILENSVKYSRYTKCSRVLTLGALRKSSERGGCDTYRQVGYVPYAGHSREGYAMSFVARPVFPPPILVEKLGKAFTDVPKFVLKQVQSRRLPPTLTPLPPHGAFPILLST
ncbi:hypothetical protein AVEN_138490-1 [Araneus ventricosus]|uniref:Uncharacterized protein n=1 Tax=Araneus ventricosus TaxID=182803 RepID=A0A4Y2CDR3_ARAVE|nr:hypothetical protein AVEN_138490-1 [Araneus ventricosus]